MSIQADFNLFFKIYFSKLLFAFLTDIVGSKINLINFKEVEGPGPGFSRK